jgi:hypothetical protein
VEIPNVDDHVSKLEHMGKETVKKLQDIRSSGAAAGIDISVPENCINKGERAAGYAAWKVTLGWELGNKCCGQFGNTWMCPYAGLRGRTSGAGGGGAG